MYGSIITRVKNCEKIVTNKGSTLCGMHRSRWEKHKSFDAPIRNKNLKCIIEGCDKPTNGRMFCDPHRALYRRTQNYIYTYPRPKLQEGYNKWCNVHGFLTPEQTRKSGKQLRCKECINKNQRENKFLEGEFIFEEIFLHADIKEIVGLLFSLRAASA